MMSTNIWSNPEKNQI